MSKKPAKRYQDMNTQELAEATKEFNREFIADLARPMNPDERAQERRADTRGRPTVGKGSEKINITIERGLLKQADRLARRERVSRSQIIARGLNVLLGRRAG